MLESIKQMDEAAGDAELMSLAKTAKLISVSISDGSFAVQMQGTKLNRVASQYNLHSKCGMFTFPTNYVRNWSEDNGIITIILKTI